MPTSAAPGGPAAPVEPVEPRAVAAPVGATELAGMVDARLLVGKVLTRRQLTLIVGDAFAALARIASPCPRIVTCCLTIARCVWRAVVARRATVAIFSMTTSLAGGWVVIVTATSYTPADLVRSRNRTRFRAPFAASTLFAGAAAPTGSAVATLGRHAAESASTARIGTEGRRSCTPPQSCGSLNQPKNLPFHQRMIDAVAPCTSAACGGPAGPAQAGGSPVAPVVTPGESQTAAGCCPVATQRAAVRRFASPSMYGATALVGSASSPAICGGLRPARIPGEKSRPTTPKAPARSSAGKLPRAWKVLNLCFSAVVACSSGLPFFA